jgi:hypothetical protein
LRISSSNPLAPIWCYEDAIRPNAVYRAGEQLVGLSREPAGELSKLNPVYGAGLAQEV